jgi:hypothetical protein
MKTEQEKALDKIKKCLRLAKSSNANEAAAAMRQAQALMQKFSLDFTDVLASDVNESCINASVKKSPTRYESYLAVMCADAFSCRVIFSSGGWNWKKGQWKFVGTGATYELAGYAFEVFFRQLKRDRTIYISEKLYRCKPATKTARADVYCESWVDAVSRLIPEVQPTREQSQAITAFFEKQYTELGELKSRKVGVKPKENDAWAGFEAGSKARLDRGVNADGTGTAALEYGL